MSIELARLGCLRLFDLFGGALGMRPLADMATCFGCRIVPAMEAAP